MSSDEVRRARLLLIVVVALLALGAGLRLWNATRDLAELLRTTLPDDSFYYFGIARHLALGHPPSIDGVNATNGYHPLWLALLVPLWRFLGSGDAQAPIRAALILGAMLDVGAGAMLFQVCRRLGLGAVASCAALFFFVVSPPQIVNATCGLETPLALLLGLALVSASLSAGAIEHPARLGVLAGLALLARTDQIFLVGAIAGALGLAAADARRWLVRFALATFATYVPWLVYSQATTGTIVQSSGVALSFVHRNIPRVWGYEHQPPAMAADRALASAREALSVLSDWLGVGAVGLGLVLGMLVMVVVRAREPGQEQTRRVLRAAAPLLGSTLVLFFAHTLGRSVFREWYSAPFAAALCVAVGVLIDHSRQLSRSAPLVTGVVMAVLVSWSVLARVEWNGAGYSQAIAGVPGDPHEGHSDCGVVSYFTGQGITNLDGIVNQRALEAMQAGHLGDYVAQQRFSRLYVTSHYQSSVFLGPHAWERLIRLDGHALRTATDEEKDQRIGPTARELGFQWNEAVEYLGDGWSCCAWPPASSVGPWSELAFTLPQPAPDARLELRLSAAVVNEAGVQPVTVSLDGTVLATLEVREQPRVFSIPLERAKRGRNRLRLAYGAPRSLPPDRNQLSWWRSDWGMPLLAVRAHGLWLRAPMQLVVDLAATDPRLECEGCYEAEQSATDSWRWTSGNAHLRLKVGGTAGTPCQVTIAVGAGRLSAVRWDGTDFGASTTFAVVLDGRAAHELELRSETFAVEGDARALGVSLQRVRLSCE